MDLKKRIELEEDLFPKIFTNYIDKEYGGLFYNEGNKVSYDSNHALIYKDKVVNLEKTLNDITDFYMSKGINPNIYQASEDNGYFESNEEIFLSCGYNVWTEESLDLMVLANENRITKTKNLDIKIVSEWDERIATDICIPCEEEYEIEVIKSGIKAKNEIVFVAYKNDKAVAITYIHTSEFDVCRYDYILVAKGERNKGYARELVSYVVEYCKDKNIENCFTWPAHRGSQKILEEAGFESFFHINIARASYIK